MYLRSMLLPAAAADELMHSTALSEDSASLSSFRLQVSRCRHRAN